MYVINTFSATALWGRCHKDITLILIAILVLPLAVRTNIKVPLF